MKCAAFLARDQGHQFVENTEAASKIGFREIANIDLSKSIDFAWGHVLGSLGDGVASCKAYEFGKPCEDIGFSLSWLVSDDLPQLYEVVVGTGSWYADETAILDHLVAALRPITFHRAFDTIS